MGENICKWYHHKWVSIQNTQTAHTTQHQKKNNPIKPGQKAWEKVFQRRHTDDQQADEKMTNTINHHRNAN